jgi:hypothetical protein
MKRLSLLIVSLGFGIAGCHAASAQQPHSADPNQSAACLCSLLRSSSDSGHGRLEP